MSHLVDSNLLLRLTQRGDRDHALARSAVRQLRGDGKTLRTAPQCMAEFWNTSTRPSTARGGYGMSIAETDHKAQLIERLMIVTPEPGGLYAVWRHLVVAAGVSGVEVHDARLYAFCLAAGIPYLLTFNDKDFIRYTRVAPGVEILHPRMYEPCLLPLVQSCNQWYNGCTVFVLSLYARNTGNSE